VVCFMYVPLSFINSEDLNGGVEREEEEKEEAKRGSLLMIAV
jgi:hypothetical protein